MSSPQKIVINSPFGKDKLLLRSLSVVERLGSLFEAELDVLSLDNAIDMESGLGESIAIAVSNTDGGSRSFSGYIAEIESGEHEEGYTSYRLKLVPWTWFLSKTSDSRIFQNKTVPEIIKEVFRENGFSDFKDRLVGSYGSLIYCVQYRETDFNFISRLMEQEGIYYYFTQEDGKHVMVLADGVGSHDPVKGHATIPFYPPGSSTYNADHVYEWGTHYATQPGKYAVNDYDPLKPKAKLLSAKSISRKHAQSSYEMYDSPGEFVTAGEGETQAKVRLEALQTRHEVMRGASTAMSLCSGATIKLTEHPADALNKEYLIVAVRHHVSGGDHRSGGSGDAQYHCSVEALDRRTPFRTQAMTPKPMISGLQTARVEGPAGEEIHTDQHGRIKVQFHWDRYGKRDDKSSCWVRVAQQWAGSGWGAQFIPRIGHEVVVSFLEGDPDRPLVIGSVYNGDNVPPFALPGNKTQSGWKTHSTPNGGAANFNELRFEDAKGKEEIFIHAEKDMREEVENDHFSLVGNDEQTNIKRDRKELVERDDIAEVQRDKQLKVTRDSKRVIDGLEDVKIAKTLKIDVGQEITIVTGQSSINMKSSGEITIKGQKILIDGAMEVAIKSMKVKADGSVSVEAKAGVNMRLEGTMVNVKAGAILKEEGAAMTVVKGGLVMIN